MRPNAGVWRIALVFCLLAAARAEAQAPRTEVFEIDSDHSAVEFTIRFMGITNIRGAFSDFGGTLMYGDDITRSSVTAVIKSASINTNSTPRDRHLKTPDFFDADKYPFIVFQSKRIVKTPVGFNAIGTLTMHGVTKEVTIPFAQQHPRMQDAWHNTRVGFAGELKVDRKEYGVNGTSFWNSEFDPGRMVVGDTATISLAIQAIIPNYELWQTPGADTLIAHIQADGADRALGDLKQHAKENPAFAQNAPKILRYSFHKLMQRKKYAEALSTAHVLTDIAPEAAASFTLLGEACLANGKRADAIQSFQTAVKLDPYETGAVEWLRTLST